MRSYYRFFIGIILVKIVLSTAPEWETDPELTAGFLEGDMIINAHQLRNGLKPDIYRWPNRIVYYYINSNIDRDHVNYILRAINIIESNSCLTFQEVNPDAEYYVNITNNPGGCYSAVGFQNKVQILNLETYPLDKGCYRLGSVLHEFLHALGFQHQQSTWNRDDYVRIATENIAEGKEHNFEKYDEHKVDNFDQDYDYGSVMHYTAYGFSKNGEMTIEPLQPSAANLMGQRLQLSQPDINKLNVMYKCPRHT